MFSILHNPPKVTAAAESVAICKDIIKSLGKRTQKGGTYEDDRSGCTYHPGQQGWHQVMAKGGQSPTCGERNQDQLRRRVCACTSPKGKIGLFLMLILPLLYSILVPL